MFLSTYFPTGRGFSSPRAKLACAVLISALLAGGCSSATTTADSDATDTTQTAEASTDTTDSTNTVEEETAEPETAADPNSKAKPDQLVLTVGGEPSDGFDPTLGWGRYGAPLFQSTLLTLDHDLEITNDLATGYEVSDDGLTWTATIRDDANFSDGTPVTTADVAYTFNTAAGSGSVVDLANLDSAEATDDSTVTFTLKEPNSTFVYQLVTIGIVPEASHGDDYGKNPIGSGPFVMERWDQEQQLVVTRNEDYYGKKPEFERIVFRYVEEDASLAGARAGESAIATVPATLATSEIDGMKLIAVDSVDNRGIMFPIPAPGTNDEGVAIGHEITSDKALRQAFNVAVDRETLVAGVLNGYGSPASGPVDGMPWYEASSKIGDANIERAKEILAAGGWEDADGDGIVEKNGVKASFEVAYPASDSVRQGLAVATAAMVKEAGIDMQLIGASWDEIGEIKNSTPVLFGWGSHNPIEMYNLHHSGLSGHKWFNTGYYKSDHVDEKLDAALTATDPQEALKYWRAAQLEGDNGFTAPADAAWAWLVNLDHMYYVDSCLDLGPLQVEPHGHGYPITKGIQNWTWTCS